MANDCLKFFILNQIIDFKVDYVQFNKLIWSFKRRFKVEQKFSIHFFIWLVVEDLT